MVNRFPEVVHRNGNIIAIDELSHPTHVNQFTKKIQNTIYYRGYSDIEIQFLKPKNAFFALGCVPVAACIDHMRKNGNIEKAIKYYERAVEIRPDIAVGHHYLAVLYGYSGFYNKSVRSAQLAIDLEPENHRSYMTRSYSYDKMGNYARSIKDMQKALQFLTQSEEDIITKYGIQGRIEYLKGNYQKSVEYYQRVTEIDNDANWAIFGLALSDLALGRIAESKKSYKKGLSISDQFDKMEAIQDLKMLVSKGIMSDEASEILQTIFDE